MIVRKDMTSRYLPVASLAAALFLSSCSWVDEGVGGNIPPRAADDAYEVAEGSTLELLTYEEGVLGNDEDGGNRQLTARLVEGKGPLYAAEDGFTFNSDGTFTYIHNGDEPPAAVEINGVVRHCDFFTYVANDGIDDGEPKDVCIDIKAVNDIPKIKAQRPISTNEDTPFTITPANLLIEDPDNSPEELSVIIRSGDHYRLEQNTIHPAENFNGDLSVELAVSDGQAVSEPFIVTVNVISVNDPTVITQKVVPIVLAEDSSRQITFDDLKVTDPDNVYPDDFTLAVSDGNNYRVDPPGSTWIRPDANYHGPLDVGITLTDRDGQATGKTLRLQVTPVNDPPVVEGTTIQVDEGGFFNAPYPGLLNADKASDVDGDDLSLDTTPVTPPQHGSLTLNADGSWRYQHDGSETTSDSFTYRVVDGNGGAGTATVTITINPVNDVPAISGNPATTVAQDAVYQFVPQVVDADPGDVLVFSIANKPVWATFDPATGTLSGTPTNADVGTTTGIVITVTDAAGASASLPPFDLTVTNVNDPPTIAGAPATSVNEDTAYSFVPVASDPDAGDTLTFSIANKPVWATFDPATGTLSGTPTNADVGTTTGIVITVTDAAGASASLPPFDLTVINVNDPPVAQPDSVTTDEDTAVTTGNVLANDSDPDGDPLAISGVDTVSAQGGTVADNGDGTFTYTPPADFNGSDSFTYTVSDGNGGTAQGTVNVTVNPVNDAPVVTAGLKFTIDENSTDGTAVGQVTATDPDGTVTGFSIVGGNTGNAFVIDNNGQITVANSSVLDFETTPSFNLQVTATDGIDTSAVQTVKISLNDIDEPPVITQGQSFSLPENSSNGTIVGTVLAVDPEGSVAGFSIVGGNTNGAFAIDNSGQITVASSAALDFETTPTFNLQITVTDGANTSAAETVSITLTNVNDEPPVVTPGQNFNLPENSPDGTMVGTVNATDVDSPVTGFSIVGGNTGNAFVIDDNGQITVANSSVLDFETTPTFDLLITATDGSNTSAAETVVINLTDIAGASVNLPPRVSAVCEATPVDVPVRSAPLNATDPDGDDRQLRFYLQSTAEKGAVIVDITGRFTYTPHPGARGTDNFTYKVIDQQGAETIGTVKIIIGKTRIMPLGDAITAGSTDGSDVTPGYRQVLRNLLIDEGYAVEFVGSQSVAPDRHEGHLGSQVTTAHVAANVEGWLDANPADVVLLHVGSQDFVSGGDVANGDARIGDILDAIGAWSISKGQPVTVLLARIIDQWPANPDIAVFNDLLARRAEPGEIVVVDQHDALDYPADLADGFHPNDSGYRKMAEAWRTVLEKGVLDRCP